MRIDRVRVKNFRNLADVDLHLQPGAVIVGENRAGKTNLLEAIRLVLDPALSSLDRYLDRGDFWDGLSDGSDDWDPMAAGEVIEISVDIVEFDDDAVALAALGEVLVADWPMRARLTYRFAPQDTGTDDVAGSVKYRWVIFGGGDENRTVPNDLRGYLALVFLHALRNVEADLNNWRRSPLRTLLEAAANAVDENDLGVVRTAMDAANEQINSLEEIKKVGTNISDRILEIVGDTQALMTELAVAPDDPLRLIRKYPRHWVGGVAQGADALPRQCFANAASRGADAGFTDHRIVWVLSTTKWSARGSQGRCAEADPRARSDKEGPRRRLPAPD